MRHVPVQRSVVADCPAVAPGGRGFHGLGYWLGPELLALIKKRKMKTHFMTEIHKYGLGRVMERVTSDALNGSLHHDSLGGR